MMLACSRFTIKVCYLKFFMTGDLLCFHSMNSRFIFIGICDFLWNKVFICFKKKNPPFLCDELNSFLICDCHTCETFLLTITCIVVFSLKGRFVGITIVDYYVALTQEYMAFHSEMIIALFIQHLAFGLNFIIINIEWNIIKYDL